MTPNKLSFNTISVDLFPTIHEEYAKTERIRFQSGLIKARNTKMSVRYILQRIGYAAVMFLFIIAVNFFIFRLMPGNPLAAQAKEMGNAEAYAKLEAAYGLDKPLHIQFLNYARDMMTLDFGRSFHYKRPVLEVIGPRILNSLKLAIFAVPIGIFGGIIGGIVTAARRGKKADVGFTTLTMFIYAIPSFWLGMILLFVFGKELGWVPFAGIQTPGISYHSFAEEFSDLFLHLVTPVVTYALAIYGSYLLIMRGSMIDVYTEDYILTARAKGLSKKQVTMRHAVPNALLPIVTIVVIALATLFAGAFSIEILFSWPGMGRLMVDSVNRQDYPVMQAINFIIAAATVFANLLVDILYRYIDPRVRYE